MKRIIIAGLYRSGSTWQFNAVRTILKHAGVIFNQHNIYHPELSIVNEGAEYEIYKLHKFDEAFLPTHLVLTSWRDTDEAFKSYQRCFVEETKGEEWWNDAVGDARKWRSYSDYNMNYELMVNSKDLIIFQLSRILRLGVNEQAVLEELETLKPPVNEDYDPVTCYFRNHIAPKE